MWHSDEILPEAYEQRENRTPRYQTSKVLISMARLLTSETANLQSVVAGHLKSKATQDQRSKIGC